MMLSSILMMYLIIKHFIIDFPLQGPYMYKNKGTFGHPGGLLHAGLHGLGTFLVFILALPWNSFYYLFLGLASLDAVLHYFIDYAKMNINNKMNWKPDNSEYYWWLLGFDQFLHYMTYVGLIWLFWYMALGA